ncbi:MAG: hypothetical protein HAW63_05500 [Bdellovibrionaceae bacterium]|nr:hypothetical protein [Pseudobdellovibrionaceae bacterium]
MSNFPYTPTSLFHINSTGNTFVVDETPLLKKLSPAEVSFWKEEEKIQQACHKHKVDGLAILFANNKHHLQWQFFNADGKPANMCGNLARGLIYYLSKKFPHEKTAFSLLGPNNTVQTGCIKNSLPFLSMPQGKKLPSSNEPYLQELYSTTFLKSLSEAYSAVTYIDLGVPHALLPIYPDQLSLPVEFIRFFNAGADLKQHSLHLMQYKIQQLNTDLQKIIQTIRCQNDKGFNVTLFNPNTLHAISFERGVENFTLSCGTGASALAYYLKTFVPLYKSATEVSISMPGGSLLINVEKKEYLLGGKCQILSVNSIEKCFEHKK